MCFGDNDDFVFASRKQFVPVILFFLYLVV